MTAQNQTVNSSAPAVKAPALGALLHKKIRFVTSTGVMAAFAATIFAGTAGAGTAHADTELGPADPLNGINKILSQGYTRLSGPARAVGSCLQEGTVAEAKSVLPANVVNQVLRVLGGKRNDVATMVEAGDPFKRCSETYAQETAMYSAGIRSSRPGIWPLV